MRSPLDSKDYPRLVLDPGGQGEMYYAGVLRALVVFAARRSWVGVVDRLRQRSEFAARARVVTAKRDRRAAGLGRKSLALDAAVADRKRVARGIGGALGLAFAVWLKDGLLAVSDWGPSALEPKLDWRVLAFTLGLSLLTGIVFGLAPAWRATRVDLTPTLKDSGRSSSAASRSLLSRGLVVTAGCAVVVAAHRRRLVCAHAAEFAAR